MVSKVALAVIGFLLLSNVASAAEEESQPNLRKLDVVFAQPTTPKPTRMPTTRRPTPSPTPRPTPSPTISNMPSISSAPTFPQAPECPALSSEEIMFCYDGKGTQWGKRYSQCSATLEVTSGHCGTYDFLIDGEYYGEFRRCGDPWKWFEACIESWGCTKRSNSGTFIGGNRKPKTAVWEGRDHKWRFQLWGNGMTSGRRIEWICQEEEEARGMQEFAKAMMAGVNLFAAEEKDCITPAPTDVPSAAPSSSHAPTSSPAPTHTAAPLCPRNGSQHEYKTPPSTRFFKKGWNTNGGWNTFEVTGRCSYQVSGSDVGGVEKMSTMDEYLARATELFSGERVASSAKLTGKAPAWNDIQWRACGSKYCTYITGCAVTEEMSFSFATSDHAKNFRNFIRWMRSKARVWETDLDDGLICGSGEFCFDQKTQTTCYVGASECSEVDFLIDGLDVGYERGNDVWPWFNKCSESFGCQRLNGGTFTYGYPSRSVYQSSSSGDWFFKLSGNGVSGSIKWKCPDEEAARGMRAYAEEVYRNGYFNMEPKECTEPPTTSPTREPCKDSLLSRGDPLNIAVVIDMSYSTYETKFDGTSVGDVNNDGKSNTILDAEIAAVLSLLDIIAASPILGNDNVDIGIVVFDTQASYKGTFAPQGHYAPLNSSNDGPNPQLVADLKALQTYTDPLDVAKYNTGFTNFDDALDKAILYFEDDDVVTDGRNNVMVFLSDGLPNVRGDGDNEDWCEKASVNCASYNLSNKPITADTPAWEEGELSFCYQGDQQCGARPYNSCALGIASCQDTEMAKSFTSELKRLDEFNVFRLSVGVGSGSDNSYDSGLYRIDNNPWKEFGVLPNQVFTTDELSMALSELCIESTDAPTTTPSAAPTGIPSASPTAVPTTKAPTAAPTIYTTEAPSAAPSVAPTGAPSKNPTATPTYSPGICEYNILDFYNPYEDDGVMYLHPYEWRSYGMRVDADSGKFVAYSTDSHGHPVLVVDDFRKEGIEPAENGGTIAITTDGDWDDAVEIILSDLDAPAKIQTLDESEQVVETIEVDPTQLRDSRPRYQISVEGTKFISVIFEGRGALGSLGICHEAQEIETWEGNAPDFLETDTPTSSPTAAPEGTKCPIELLTAVGDMDADLTLDTPIQILERSPDGSSVKVQVKNSWFSITSSPTEAMYVSAQARNGDEQCLSTQEVAEDWTDDYELHCVHHDYALVSIYVVDEGFQNMVASSASIPICCHPDEESTSPVIEYVFKVKCDCPEDVFELSSAGASRQGRREQSGTSELLRTRGGLRR